MYKMPTISVPPSKVRCDLDSKPTTDLNALGVGRSGRKPALSPSSEDYANLAAAPPIVHEVLGSPGQSLDPGTRTLMESRFQHDFSGVKIHANGKAAESARALNATAYTVRQDIAFDAGKYDAGGREGQQLLAHELTHVVQQSRGGKGLPDAHSEQSAELAGSAFGQTSGRIAVAGATAIGIARQKAPQAAPKPSVNVSFQQQPDRTLILFNNVVVAESDASSVDIEVSPPFLTPERILVVITVPEGKTANVIESESTREVLAKLAPKYAIMVQGKSKVPPRGQGERDGTIDPSPTYTRQGTFEGQRSKPPPAKKAPNPPSSPPTVQPPANLPPAQPPFVFQPFKSPPTDINLPPTAKYGKPPTDQEIAREKINKIISDAMAGRSNIPPLPTGLEPGSAVELIQHAVGDAVKPLLRGLPKDAREFILDKLNSAVEEGVVGIAESAVDSAKLDGPAKAAIKKAIEAAIKLKPAPAKP